MTDRSFNALMDAFGHVDRLSDARDTLHELRAARFEPDLITFVGTTEVLFANALP